MSEVPLQRGPMRLGLALLQDTDAAWRVSVTKASRLPSSEDGTTSKVLRTFTRKTRPVPGLDCLTCAEFARQRPGPVQVRQPHGGVRPFHQKSASLTDLA